MHKSHTTREQAIEVRLSFREAEWRLNAELFLDEYPRWEIEAPHWSVILHDMFLHATEWGQKEAERFLWWGHQCSLPRPDHEVDLPTMKLVGYETSHKEIRDCYHSVYMLRKSPGPLPCGPQQREAIWDILSSLRSHLHWCVYPIAAEEDTWGAVTKSQSRPRGREDQHEEACQEARAAHQRVLEAAQVLESNIKSLSQGLRDVQHTWSCSCSGSHLQSQSLDRWSRSLNRPWQERRVTFWEPEVELDPEERSYKGAPGWFSRIFLKSGDGVSPSAQRQETACPPMRPMACQDAEGRGNYPAEPSIQHVETWLDWQAHQMDMPYWWTELTAIPGVEDPWKLTWKICAFFLILAIRRKVFPGQGYTAPHAPKCLTWNVFLPDELSYQDMQ